MNATDASAVLAGNQRIDETWEMLPVASDLVAGGLKRIQLRIISIDANYHYLQ